MTETDEIGLHNIAVDFLVQGPVRGCDPECR